MKKSNWLKWPQKIMLILFLCTAGTVTLQAQHYAFMYIDSSSPSSLSCTQNTWRTVGSATAFTSGITPSSTWTSTATALNSGSSGAGDYLVMYSLSFAADQGEWEAGISIGGAAPSVIYNQRSIGNSSKEVGNVSGMALLAIGNNTTVELQVRQTSSGSALTADTYKAQVVVVELTNISPDYYTEMKLVGNTTALATSATYATQTGFSAGLNNGWSAASSVLTAGASSEGTYLVIMSASLKCTSTSQPYRIGVSVDGASPNKILTRRYFYNTSSFGNVLACGIISVKADPATTLQVKANGPSSGDIVMENASLALYKINGSTASTHSGMYVSNNSTATTMDQSAWSQLTAGMTAMTTTNSFSHSSGTLTPQGLSAGTYLVNYSCSLLGASTTAVKVYTSIFVGGIEQTNLTTVRTVNSSTSPGAIGGTGLITLTVPTDNIMLKMKNITNGDDITVTYSNVTLNRVTYSGDGSLPVELSRWEASSGQGDVRLEWTTESEMENQGFVIERKLVDASKFTRIASYMTDETLIGQGSTSRRSEYAFIDGDVKVGQRYEYRLSDVDYKGKLTQHEIISVTVTLDDNTQQPGSVSLMHAYPNPFNPATTIEYAISQASQVSLTIYDLGGNEIARLVQGPQEAGWHSVVWNGLDNQGQSIPTGVYLAHLQDPSHSRVIKISYLK